MGNGSSSPDRNELGDEVFRIAESYLHIDDIDVLEKITGMIFNSVNDDSDKLHNLLVSDRNELERRIGECARVIQQNQDNHKSDRNSDTPVVDLTKDIKRRRQDLKSHFQRFYPLLDSSKVANELLKLKESELNYILSTPAELKTFIKACSLDEESDDIKKGATSPVLDAEDQIERLKEEHLKELSKPELCEEDIETFIGSHLFKRVSLVHPSKAELLTGVLMGIERDAILQLLVSASALHLSIASVIKKLVDSGKLSRKDMTFMQEELGDLIHSVVEKDLDQETACRVTGMLIEIDLVCLHEILADDSIFRKRVGDAVQACKSTS